MSTLTIGAISFKLLEDILEGAEKLTPRTLAPTRALKSLSPQSMERLQKSCT